MNENIKTQGPTVSEEQLIDVYRSNQDQASPWLVISDQVMGGVSTAALRQDQRQNSNCSCLVGRTSLDNNGGFVQTVSVKLVVRYSKLLASNSLELQSSLLAG